MDPPLKVKVSYWSQVIAEVRVRVMVWEEGGAFSVWLFLASTNITVSIRVGGNYWQHES